MSVLPKGPGLKPGDMDGETNPWEADTRAGGGLLALCLSVAGQSASSVPEGDQ